MKREFDYLRINSEFVFDGTSSYIEGVVEANMRDEITIVVIKQWLQSINIAMKSFTGTTDHNNVMRWKADITKIQRI